MLAFTTQAEPGPEKTWVKPIKTPVLNGPAHCNLVANQYFFFKFSNDVANNIYFKNSNSCL